MSPIPFTVIIPARLASTRLPDKALADIAGLPMIVRVAQQAAKSMAQNIIVATDHQDILDRLGGFPATDTGSQHLRHEFPAHARAGPDMGIPVSAGTDGVFRHCAVLVLQAQTLAVDRPAQAIAAKAPTIAAWRMHR